MVWKLSCQVNLLACNIQFQPVAPSRSSGWVTAYNLSSTSLLVKWSHLPEEDFKGQPVGYTISYYLDDSKSDTYSTSVKYTKNTTTLTNLTVYTMYVINVSAVSSGGIGPANTAKARTGAEGMDFLYIV